MHELGEFINSKGDVRSGESKILKGTNKSAVWSRIDSRRGIGGRERIGGAKGCEYFLGTVHFECGENIMDVSVLGEE